MKDTKEERQAAATKIALELMKRRRSGDVVSMEAAIALYPTLKLELREQLDRLLRIENARQPELSAEEMDSSDQLSAPPDSSDPFLLDSNPATPKAPRSLLRFTMKELDEESCLRLTRAIDDSSPSRSKISESTTPLYRPTVRPPMALLQLVHDGQRTTTTYPIMKESFRIGRLEGDLTVPFDRWISGKHAELQRRFEQGRYRWFLVDLKSTNGTFIQTKTAELQHGDELFLGRERYRFLLQNGNPGLMHITKGQGAQWWPRSSRIGIGREVPSDLKAFENDPFLDPFHAEILRNDQGKWVISDNQSRNGTWYRVDEAELLPECLFQLGEQRFCFSWEPHPTF